MSEQENTQKNMEVWSVNDILTNYPTLGIPHFQRGSVWSDENIAALLESLYFDTPCGSIVLWPNDQQENGKLFPMKKTKNGASSSRIFDKLVIDGQQRIRSLYSVFAGETEYHNDPVDDGSDSSESPGNDGEEGAAVPYVWAINLFAALSQEQKDLHIRAKNQPRYRNLFAKVQDPETKKDKSQVYPYQYDFFPLKYIGKTDFNICFADEVPKKPCIFVDVDVSDPKAKNELRKRIKDTLIDKVLPSLTKLKTRNAFAVYLLSEDSKLEDVIHTFIRINSGGRPVQSEEKAFSRLVQLCPCEIEPNGSKLNGTADYVKNIFNSIQELEGHSVNQSEDNDYLQRLQERQFGFRLFIRVFILAMNYHTGKAIGTTGLSFSVIQEEARQLTGGSEEERGKNILSLRELWEITSRIVIAVRRLLMDQLKLDTLAFLPDSRSLLPVFMLLIKHPDFMTGEGKYYEIKDDYKMHFAYILLTVLLAATGENEGEIMKLTTLLREVPLTGEKTLQLLVAGELLNSGLENFAESMERCKNLEEKWRKIVTAAAEIGKENGRLQYANSLTNRYVLLLYALERRQGVCDFYGASLPKWDTCPQEKHLDETNRWRRYEKYDDSLLISEKSFPEKQHIVPYSAFRHSYGGKGRVVNSPANNIGNITYISQDQNRESLGCRWLWLSGLDEKLKKGHLISPKAVMQFYAIGEKDGDQCDPSEIDKSRVQKVENGHNNFALLPDKDKHYEAWLKVRRERIAEEFSTWCRELKDSADKTKFVKIVPHEKAIFIGKDERAVDCAFLPQLWSSNIEPGLKQLVSWFAWNAGTAISKNTLTIRPNKEEKKTVSIDLKNAENALARLRELFPDWKEIKNV